MLHELATFNAVVRTGSMSKAAMELHLSQPAISQRLRALEEHYGMPLLHRTNRGVEVTPAGELLSRYAQRVLGLDRALEQEMAALRESEPQQAVIGATSVIGGYALPCTIYLFQQKHPSARVQLMMGKRAEIRQRLEDGLLDFALVEGPETVTPLDGWQSAVVSEDELVLITPTEGPLAEREVYTVEDLRRAPLIVREPGAASRQVIEQAWKQMGYDWRDLNVAMELGSVDAVKTSVASGHGVALLSKWCVRVEARTGALRITPVEGIRFVSQWTLFYPRTGDRKALHRSLLRTLRSPGERGFC